MEQTRLIRFDSDPSKDGAILRFRKTERWLHWAIAVPFMICWLSALILVLVYNPDPHRPYRLAFSWFHRFSGAALIAFPLYVLFKSREEYRIHTANIRTAWHWSLDDMKWLLLMGLAAISRKITLPEQGKFNAAEKVNFMVVMLSSPIFILTGLMMWIQDAAWFPWLIHGCAALAVTPTMLGHIYMATVNPDTRSGITGMVSGYVERQWAKHHYALWYREHFENNILPARDLSGIAPQPERRIHIHCPACSKDMITSWTWLLQRVFSLRAIRCPGCGATFTAITAITDQHQLRWIKLQFDAGETAIASNYNSGVTPPSSNI
jgi:formate dehydrogenase subunit gamma